MHWLFCLDALSCRIYAKPLEHFNLDEFGTNFAEKIYNSRGFAPDEYYESRCVEK